MNTYEEAKMRLHLSNISQSIEFLTQNAIGSGGVAADVIGGATNLINPGMERNIWEIIATAADGSEQNVEVRAGDTTDYDRTKIFLKRIPNIANASPLTLGGDPLKPLFKSPVVENDSFNNLLIALHETSGINLLIRSYDTPLSARSMA